MGDVGEWLERLGLSRYRAVFAEHDIDREILPDLTDQDLEKLGLSLGHRKKLLRAIAELTQADSEPQRDFEGAAHAAERRQLTVLFCDLVGSTELAAWLDPEDLRGVMRAYHRCSAAVVELFEGHVAKYLGDGVLAYFGWPRAHEDDAEQAVRAGLQLVEDVGRLNPHPEVRLQARVGIATGIAVVGDLIGEGAAREEAVVGEVPNLAARLQALAAPGSVVISQATRRLVGGLFELDELGPVRLRGFAEPLAAFRVAGEGRAEGRFEARQTAGLTPLVGRDEELALLLHRWQQAEDGEGQVVLLSGEPGIGKSRLVRELRARLAGEPHIRLLYQCSPHHTTSPLHPVIAQLERAAGFARDDSPEARLAKLEMLLARGTDRIDQRLPLIAALLGLPAEDRYPALDVTPQRQKQLTLEALIDQLKGLAAEQPVFLAYEDVHWIDPTTQELLGLTIERIERLPVLCIVTFRPEFSPPWTGPHVSALALSRLGRREGADLVGRVTGAKPLPDAIVEQILARTDGVPLFVEELTKTVLESGLLHDAVDHWELAGPPPPLSIPTTLHDSLMARLDRLARIKEIAQIGAVIGREFSHELLTAVSPLPRDKLGEALEQLVQSELVFRRGGPPDLSYSFKHPLVQDAAYQSLLKSKRQQLHARIADVLEKRLTEAGEIGPEVLARHLTEAGETKRAIHYWRRAGELAAGRSANREAIAHLSKGLELVGQLSDAPEHRREELSLRLAIGGPLIATKGHADSEVERTYSRARALCDQAGQSVELFPALRGLWHYYLVRGELRLAHDLAERLAALAEEEKEAPIHRALARRARGTTLFYLGRFGEAAAIMDGAIKIADPVEASDEHRADLLLYTERAGVVCRLFSAWALWFLGFPDRALARLVDGQALARKLSHVYSRAFAQDFAAVLHNLRRDFSAAQKEAEALRQTATDYGMSQRLAEATICGGFAMVGLGKEIDGIAELRSGLNSWNATGARVFQTQWFGFLADAYVQAGQFNDALTALDHADGIAATTSECHYQAELYRLRGVVLAATGENAEAALWLERAIHTARSQQAKSLELRAAMSLARLWRDQGRPTEACDLLAPVYGWFTEGFDAADLKEAKGLLDELA
jgi:class 3 adenylate cyclase/predicted ATPase